MLTKGRSAALALAVAMTGCATPARTQIPSKPLSADTDHAAAAPAVTRRVSLPYVFTRHGVEIRVNSIESANAQELVSVTLQETKGQETDLPISTLTQVVTAAGQSLPYVQYSRGDKTEKDPSIHLAARDQFSITLFYQLPAGTAETGGNSVELRFPTGKFWSSRVDD